MAISTRLYEEAQNNSEALVLAHLGLVKRVALHLKVRMPPFMELDELIQVGMIGLLEASRAYDPAKGIEFENFAHSRVRGAMLDEVRRLSFLPRSAVAFNKEHNEATHTLAAELGRTPTQGELAEHMGKDIQLFQKERSQARRFENYSMAVVTDEVMNIATDTSQQPEAIGEHEQFTGVLTHAIADLPEADQWLIDLSSVEDCHLKELISVWVLPGQGEGTLLYTHV